MAATHTLGELFRLLSLKRSFEMRDEIMQHFDLLPKQYYRWRCGDVPPTKQAELDAILEKYEKLLSNH